MNEIIIFIIISFFLIIFIWYIISNVKYKIEIHKQTEKNLTKCRNDLYEKIKELEDITNETEKKEKEYKKLLSEKELTINEMVKYIEIKEEKFTNTIRKKDLLYSKLINCNQESIEYISSLISDYLTLQYEISANYLENKPHPAIKEASRIKDLKNQTNEIIKSYKILQYKVDILLQIFPDLELYIDDIDSISFIKCSNSINEISNITDKTRNYLSKEEYNNLPENTRNQLALDRYIKSNNKSRWEIGRDYELFIGHEYQKEGWRVEYFGIEKKIEDLGRDIIATKGGDVHIVQCKYWSRNKEIHENHIAQLYGTTVQYILSTSKKNVTPVLVTNINLSSQAKLFAEYLKVKVVTNKEIGNFPRIKCNINRNSSGKITKIYHLPMDQQYDRTKISSEGEFFAFTVREAVDAGFRRAWRWHGQ